MNLEPIREHYAKVKAEFGETPQGVDWNNSGAQNDRLKALSLLCHGEGYSLNDWGCGYQWARAFFLCDEYRGYDLNLWTPDTIISPVPTITADYTIASGLFNVKCDTPESKWRDYVNECIGLMFRFSRKGFGFNMLPTWCKVRKPNLYYALPYDVATYCRQYGRVSLLQHYSEFDFTILVHK